ncbi:hypothetical protein MJO28_006062 [Puccinia striiformis f. sp. tritici]|uniref:Uncharacterized protein n=1 Tax=Puccinia striiformis f. sp. tritici TaxID=168172 RepID=A0ACC0EGD4_9BASI|nr:hypothetical protein Pst134EB_012265 [Puccinia striiformis f. sp. tritici]KAI7953515.1 hypothetical protein MJO28_006062 [Puccinia striiformis f. sp. tritici]KAI7957859.1 hypothetical protein MJO29_006076 [Puccinia striiformis f. sp. tritici]
MQLLNLFQRPHITLLVVAIVITVHSALAMPPPKEEKVTCDEYFYPSKDPHTYMCRSNHVTHKCPIDSCKVDDKAWPQATFKNCDLLNKQRQIITGHTIPSVTPYQYHTNPAGTDVQDSKTGKWYRCTAAKDKSNDHRSACEKCLKV